MVRYPLIWLRKIAKISLSNAVLAEALMAFHALNFVLVEIRKSRFGPEPEFAILKWVGLLEPDGLLSIAIPCDPGRLWRLGQKIGYNNLSSALLSRNTIGHVTRAYQPYPTGYQDRRLLFLRPEDEMVSVHYSDSRFQFRLRPALRNNDFRRASRNSRQR
jgi:hypothetical protein